MIRYSLRCSDDHGFESWFASASAYERLQAASQLSCPVCGSSKVEKALMAPAVASASEPAQPEPAPRLEAPNPELAEKLAAWRRHVEENSDYVGDDFSREVRAIHEGEAPDRPIWGEAKAEEAKAMIEEGLPVAPLPFVPRSKTN